MNGLHLSRNASHPRNGDFKRDRTVRGDQRRVGLSSGPVAHMLLCAVNRNEPAFASRRPQFINGREIRGRIVEGADANFDFVGAIDKPKH